MPYTRRAYKAKPKRYAKKVRQNKPRKMLTGQEPSFVEQLASGVGSVAKLAQAVLPAISAINTESKYYDETASFTTYGTNSNPDLRCITDSISAGTGDSNRIGNSVLAKDIQIRLAMAMPMTTNASSVVLGAFHRFMIFAWKFNDAGGPSLTKLLESPTNIYSPVNKNYSDQFVVLKDKFLTFNAQLVPGTVSNGLGTMDFKHLKYFKKLDWHLRWDDSNNAIANHIWILSMSSSSGVTNAVSTTFYSRLNFTDN